MGPAREAVEAQHFAVVGGRAHAQRRPTLGVGRAMIDLDADRADGLVRGDGHGGSVAACSRRPRDATEQAGRDDARHASDVAVAGRGAANEPRDRRARGLRLRAQRVGVDVENVAVVACRDRGAGGVGLRAEHVGDAIRRQCACTLAGAREHRVLRRDDVDDRARHPHDAIAWPARKLRDQCVDDLDRMAGGARPEAIGVAVTVGIARERLDPFVLEVAARVRCIGHAAAVRQDRDAGGREHLHRQRRSRARNAGDDDDGRVGHGRGGGHRANVATAGATGRPANRARLRGPGPDIYARRMPATGPFPSDYASARDAFRSAARDAGADLGGHAIGARASDGGELTIDTAYLGPGSPRAVVALSSGIHGVEGFAGSAIQCASLASGIANGRAPDTGVLWIHAVNPYGFAERRRVNESNVDLNRNFVAHPDGHVANPGYDDLFDAINPTSLDDESERRCRARLRAYADEHGAVAMQVALTRGQYAHPRGVQFGGTAREDSARSLQRIAADETRGAESIVWLDLHTGLGPFGSLELISEYAPGTPAFDRAAAWFGPCVRSTTAGDSVSVPLCGVIEHGLEEALPGRALTPLAAEFGTYDSTRVFWAMRADNWLHQHGDPSSALGHEIRAELSEVFCPDSAEWRANVLDQAETAIRQALSALGA